MKKEDVIIIEIVYYEQMIDKPIIRQIKQVTKGDKLFYRLLKEVKE